MGQFKPANAQPEKSFQFSKYKYPPFCRPLRGLESGIELGSQGVVPMRRDSPWAIIFRALGAGDSSFDTDSEALGYTVVRLADLSLGDRTLLCETPNPYAIFSLFKNLPVFICRGFALIRKV